MSIMSRVGNASATQVTDGVDVRLQGDVERDKVDAMIAKCGTGTCSCCGPEFIEKLDGMEVEGRDGDVTIHVKGKGVTSDVISEKLSICDCYGE